MVDLPLLPLFVGGGRANPFWKWLAEKSPLPAETGVGRGGETFSLAWNALGNLDDLPVGGPPTEVSA